MGKFLKSIIFILLIIFGNLLYKDTSFAEKDETYFVVTAYYSPLPNQKNYITGSYWGDIRLNGKGHTTSSGKPVQVGILAAPKKYPFGTKIYFYGYGVGTVEDRGGAIVKAGVRGYEYDRIDIWVGYGDEGLMRARKWGKRKIKGTVVSKNSKTSLKFSEDVLKNMQSVKINPNYPNVEDVKKLQENFKKLGLYNGEIDGKYKSIEKDLINFQIKNKVIKSKTQIDAGWFGPKTYITLLKKYGPKDIIVKQDNINIKPTSSKVRIILQHEEINLNGDNPEKEEVRKLQSLFKKLGKYAGEIDGEYDSIKRILLDFQKQAGIIKSDESWGAGYFGEKTKAALVTYFENKEEVINRKKTVTIDNITYKQLDKIGRRLKHKKNKNEMIKRLKKLEKKLKKESQIKKVKYVISIIESK